jgi:hypothetical protein
MRIDEEYEEMRMIRMITRMRRRGRGGWKMKMSRRRGKECVKG